MKLVRQDIYGGYNAAQLAVTDLSRDALRLFLGYEGGHMEKWEYAISAYKTDPAGGSEHWAELVKRPGAYYLAQAERDIVSALISSDSGHIFSDVKTLVEFGPGSSEAVCGKTIPFASACRALDLYVGIDASYEQADSASQMISSSLGVTSKVIQADFTKGNFARSWEGPAAYVMWGSTIGNLPGTAGEDPEWKLAHEIALLQKTLVLGDFLVIIFDTNNDEESVLRAYNEPALKRQSLSWLYGLKRDGLATGNFDPRVWVHEPVWFPDVMQCAHTIFPMFDQTLNIAGHTIKVPTWRRFVSNNSYKFKPETMIKAANRAGLQAQVIQHGPMALLIAQK